MSGTESTEPCNTTSAPPICFTNRNVASSLQFSRNAYCFTNGVEKIFFKCVCHGCTRMRRTVEVVVMENPLSASVLSVLNTQSQQSASAPCGNAMRRLARSVCVRTVLLCSAIVWVVWKHHELWLTQRRLALPACLIGSWCHSRMWSVSESEILVCTAMLEIRQQVVRVMLLDLYSTSAMLRTRLCVLCISTNGADGFSGHMLWPLTWKCFIMRGLVLLYKREPLYWKI